MKKKFLWVFVLLFALGLVVAAALWVIPVLNPQPQGDYSTLKGLYANEKAPREPIVCGPFPPEGTILYTRGTEDVDGVFTREVSGQAYVGSKEEVLTLASQPGAVVTKSKEQLRASVEKGYPRELSLCLAADIAVVLEVLETVDVIGYSNSRPNDETLAKYPDRFPQFVEDPNFGIVYGFGCLARCKVIEVLARRADQPVDLYAGDECMVSMPASCYVAVDVSPAMQAGDRFVITLGSRANDQAGQSFFPKPYCDYIGVSNHFIYMPITLDEKGNQRVDTEMLSYLITTRNLPDVESWNIPVLSRYFDANFKEYPLQGSDPADYMTYPADDAWYDRLFEYTSPTSVF